MPGDRPGSGRNSDGAVVILCLQPGRIHGPCDGRGRPLSRAYRRRRPFRADGFGGRAWTDEQGIPRRRKGELLLLRLEPNVAAVVGRGVERIRGLGHDLQKSRLRRPCPVSAVLMASSKWVLPDSFAPTTAVMSGSIGIGTCGIQTPSTCCHGTGFAPGSAYSS